MKVNQGGKEWENGILKEINYENEMEIQITTSYCKLE
jgi:hypothetical protein